jgi:ABC-type nickel/cobalt efflux system permease component RcnA
MLLLAADLPQFTSTELIIGLTVGGILLVVLIILWMVMRHLRKCRELLHKERLKALELGQSPNFSTPEKDQEQDAPKGQEHYADNASWIAFWIGAGVPASAAWAAASVAIQGNLRELGSGLVLGIWITVAVVSVASVVCATILMIKARRGATNDKKPGPHSSVVSDARS